MRLGGIAAWGAVAVMMLAGCSGEPAAKPSPKPTPRMVTAASETHAPGGGVDVRTLKLTASQLRSEASWGNPRIQLDWPEPASTPKLATALRRQVEQWRRDFTAEANSSRPSLTTSWDPVANADGIIGVRLVQTNFGGADVAYSTIALYGDASHAWTSMDLLAPGSTSALQGAIQKAVAKTTKAGTDWPSPPEDVFTDITFDTNGDMLVHVGEGLLAPMSSGLLVARVPNSQVYLSDVGKRVRAAAMKSPKAPTAGKNVPTPTVTPSAPTKKSVDCAKTKCVALTFDDGPGKNTEQVAKTLASLGAKGTFFVDGSAAEAAPTTVRYLTQQHMAVGVQPWGHTNVTKADPAEAKTSVNRAVQTLTAQGVKPVGVRPPYGMFDASSPHAGLPFVLWNVDPSDTTATSATSLTRQVVSQASAGSIVLLHENAPVTAQAVRPMVQQLQKQGYTLVTVDELIGSMNANTAYYSRTKTSSVKPTQ